MSGATSELRPDAGPKARIFAMLLYAGLLVALQAYLVEGGLTPDHRSIWLYTGVASLLFGSRLLNPYFTPPADSATNAFGSLIALIAAAIAVAPGTTDAWVLAVAIGFSIIVLILALGYLLFRPAAGTPSNLLSRATETLLKQLGSPVVMFTMVILVSVWLFHRQRPIEVFAILAS